MVSSDDEPVKDVGREGSPFSRRTTYDGGQFQVSREQSRAMPSVRTAEEEEKTAGDRIASVFQECNLGFIPNTYICNDLLVGGLGLLALVYYFR